MVFSTCAGRMAPPTLKQVPSRQALPRPKKVAYRQMGRHPPPTLEAGVLAPTLVTFLLRCSGHTGLLGYVALALVASLVTVVNSATEGPAVLAGASAKPAVAFNPAPAAPAPTSKLLQLPCTARTLPPPFPPPPLLRRC